MLATVSEQTNVFLVGLILVLFCGCVFVSETFVCFGAVGVP